MNILEKFTKLLRIVISLEKIIAVKESLNRKVKGYSYWSYKTHRWVKGKFDRKTKQFIAPPKDL